MDVVKMQSDNLPKAEDTGPSRVHNVAHARAVATENGFQITKSDISHSRPYLPVPCTAL
jgi:hypothetical protein